jgi:hypothetical protein
MPLMHQDVIREILKFIEISMVTVLKDEEVTGNCSLLPKVQTCSATYTTSYVMGSGRYFSRGKADRA